MIEIQIQIPSGPGIEQQIGQIGHAAILAGGTVRMFGVEDAADTEMVESFSPASGEVETLPPKGRGR